MPIDLKKLNRLRKKAGRKVGKKTHDLVQGYKKGADKLGEGIGAMAFNLVEDYKKMKGKDSPKPKMKMYKPKPKPKPKKKGGGMLGETKRRVMSRRQRLMKELDRINE